MRAFLHRLIKSREFLKGGATFLIALVAVSTVTYAGSLTPPVPVTATFYTLTDIYELITNNTTATEGGHDFTFSDALSGSGYTLAQIYDALADLIDASTILTGNTYLGVAGTYDVTNLSATTVKSGIAFGAGLTGAYPSADDPLPGADSTTDLEADSGSITSSNGDVEWWSSSGTRFTATLDFPELSNVCDTDTSNNSAGALTVSTTTALSVGSSVCGVTGTLFQNLFNGSGEFATGGSQDQGGEDDGAALSTDGYAGSWRQCEAGNSYCDTGDSGADAQDLLTGLVWSKPCNGNGCLTFSDSSPLSYSWDNSGGNNGGKTAAELCEGHSGWYLPHQKQAMQASVNRAVVNLVETGLTRFWTATTASLDLSRAWEVIIESGFVVDSTKTTTRRVRCVWGGVPAP